MDKGSFRQATAADLPAMLGLRFVASHVGMKKKL
jgi:hypothetical protein